MRLLHEVLHETIACDMTAILQRQSSLGRDIAPVGLQFEALALAQAIVSFNSLMQYYSLIFFLWRRTIRTPYVDVALQVLSAGVHLCDGAADVPLPPPRLFVPHKQTRGFFLILASFFV